MLADILSITAIVVAGASLGWQVVTWRQSGAVVKVTASQSVPVFGNNVGDWHLDITAANKGRSAVTVNNWGMKLRDGRRMAIRDFAPFSAACPLRLEPGASASWYVLTDNVIGSCEGQDIRHQDLIAFVRLGDGREIAARRRGIGRK